MPWAMLSQMMLALCSGPLADVVKIVKVAKARKGLEHQLECVPMSMPAKVPLTLLVPVSPSARVELAYLWARHCTSAWLLTMTGSDNGVNLGLQA